MAGGRVELAPFGGRRHAGSDGTALADQVPVGQVLAQRVPRLGGVAADGALVVQPVVDAHVHLEVVRVRQHLDAAQATQK